MPRLPAPSARLLVSSYCRSSHSRHGQTIDGAGRWSRDGLAVGGGPRCHRPAGRPTCLAYCSPPAPTSPPPEAPGESWMGFRSSHSAFLIPHHLPSGVRDKENGGEGGGEWEGVEWSGGGRQEGGARPQLARDPQVVHVSLRCRYEKGIVSETTGQAGTSGQHIRCDI